MTEMLERTYYDEKLMPLHADQRRHAMFDPCLRPMNQCLECDQPPRHYLVDVDDDTLHTRLCDKHVTLYDKEMIEDVGGIPVKRPLRDTYNLRPDPEFES